MSRILVVEDDEAMAVALQDGFSYEGHEVTRASDGEEGLRLARDELLDAVWGYDTIPFTRTVDTHIAKLRKKIEDDPSNPKLLITVHRYGYKLVG